jgi:hypothetical protein
MKRSGWDAPLDGAPEDERLDLVVATAGSSGSERV